MYKKYDLVTIVRVPDKDLEKLIGEEGIIIATDSSYGYPYEVVFFDREAQEFSMGEGILLWKSYHLERI